MRVVGIVSGIVFHVPGDGVDQSAAVVSVSGVHYQSGGFVHHHEVVVFIDDIERDVFGYDLVLVAWAIHHEGDDIHRLYLVTTLDGLAVGHDAAGFRGFLYAVSRGVRQSVEQVLVYAHHLLALVHDHAEVLVELRFVTDGFHIVQVFSCYVVRQFFYHFSLSLYLLWYCNERDVSVFRSAEVRTRIRLRRSFRRRRALRFPSGGSRLPVAFLHRLLQ